MRSLRPRLIAFAVIAIAAALCAAWLVMGVLFDHYVEQRMADSLIRQGETLSSTLVIDREGMPTVDPLLLDPGFRRPGSGLYWEVRTGRGTLGSASLAGRTLAASTESRAGPKGWTEGEAPGPGEGDLILVEQRVNIGGNLVELRLAEDDEPIDRARDSFTREMAIFLVALGLALSAGAWLQVWLGLWPLHRVRKELELMERNPATRLSDRHPREIAGVTAAINALADARSDDLARARRRAADLAHALKTPLAALHAQSRVARAAGAVAAADAIDKTLGAAAAVLETELARARAASTRVGEGVDATSAAEEVEGLFAVLERTDHARNLVFTHDIPAHWRLNVDRGSYTEIFGNILENAARHARRVVSVSGRKADRSVEIVIDDDGPGIPLSERTNVLRRGVRLDESGSGHGLGLAITCDLMDATGGTLSLEESPKGGLRVRLRWPMSLLSMAGSSDESLRLPRDARQWRSFRFFRGAIA